MRLIFIAVGSDPTAGAAQPTSREAGVKTLYRPGRSRITIGNYAGIAQT
jgi:hypothetical protein